MHRPALIFPVLLALLTASLGLGLAAGQELLSPGTLWSILRDPAGGHGYIGAIVLHQRLPRSLIAVYAGAMMASSGLVFQGLVRNPLASSSTLGVNAGATLAVILCAVVWNANAQVQGLAALAGGVVGFLACLAVARVAASTGQGQDLTLILSGSLVGILLYGIANTILLAHPELRRDYLPWLGGNINHAYRDRLADYWWIGAACMAALLATARPLTLHLLGADKTRSVGAHPVLVPRVALVAAILGASSAVAICGPVGFVGLVVPHVIRPLVGPSMLRALPAAALAGAILCLIADIGARVLFLPYVVHTGIIMDVAGGLAFIWIIRRFYLRPGAMT